VTEHRDRPASSPPGRPVAPGTAGGRPVRVLAELHAGALTPEAAAEVRARLEPGALTVLAALDTTVAELAVLGAEPVAVPLPPEVSARLDAALAGLRPPTAVPVPPDHGPRPSPVTDLATARRARAGRRRAVGTGALAAAAAAVVAVVVLGGLVGGPATTSGTAVAAPLDLGGGALGATVLASLGTTDLGPLRDPTVLAGCLAANGVPAGAPVLGSSQVLLRGEPGTLLLLPTGTAGAFTALVVGPACSAGDPALLVRQQIGAR
jgi:hypothetical protein